MLITSFFPLWIAIAFITTWNLFTLRELIAELGMYYHDFGYGYELVVPQVLLADWLEYSYQRYAVQIIFTGIVLATAVVATVYVLAFVSRKSRRSENSGIAKILVAKKSTTLVTDFLLFYILPMIAFDFSSVRDICLFLIYFALLS